MKYEIATSVLAIGLSFPFALAAQQNAAARPEIEPEATEALDRMGAYLRSLKAFEIKSQRSQEEVLTNGLKVLRTQNATLLARFPDRLRARIEGDNGTRIHFFDGKTFTFFSLDDKYYASFAAPSTLAKLADALDEYDIDMPLVDLFLWGRPDSTPPKLTAAIDVGPTTVDGITCEQYAFRQEGLDWQLWIQLGDYPLPRKMVLTTTTDEARPQHTVVLHWNLAPSYNEAAFVFDPPPDARKIVFASRK